MNVEYIFIKSANEYYASEEMFRNFLCTNKRIKFKGIKDESDKMILLFDTHELEYALEFVTVEKSKEIIFHLIVKTTGNEAEQVKLLEEFDCLIKDINEKNGKHFSINTIWNDISSYYAKELYPQILNLENMLRKIIYLFMLKTVGSEWLSKETPEKFQTDIYSIIEKNNKEVSEIDAEWLSYADFITLVRFFTAPYPLKSDLTSLFKELEKYKDIEKINDEEYKTTDKVGNKHSSQKLTSEILKKLSDEYETKNNWERYFSDKLKVKSPTKFSKDWGTLYNIRNKVAHGKKIDKTDFDKAKSLIDLYTEVFIECIQIIDTLEITIEEADAVEAVVQQVISKEQMNSFPSDEISKNMAQLVSVGLYPYNDNNYFDMVKKQLTKMGKKLNLGDIFFLNTKSMEDMSKSISEVSGIATLNEALKVNRTTAFLDKPLFINPVPSCFALDEKGYFVKKDNK